MTTLEQVKEFNRQIKEALQTIFDALNQGQQNKIQKDETVKELLERYGII